MAALQAMRVPDDSLLKNLEQIPFLEPPPPVQNPFDVDDEEDTPSMRELVYTIDSHVELVDLEVTSNLNDALHGPQHAGDVQAQSFPKDVSIQPTEDTAPLQPTDPSA